jgi:uncharacterized protein
MEFDNSFEVPLPVEEAWKVLMDIRRVAPCMPGAELTDVVDERTYKGRIAVRLGPVALAFAGTVRFEEIDEANHSARVAAQGSDAKGRGSANASAAFRLEPTAGGSKVLVHTDLTLAGAVAQYGRGVGIIQMTAAQIITQFANNLKAQLAPDAISATRPVVPASATTPGGGPASGNVDLAGMAWSAPVSPSPSSMPQGARPAPPAAKPIAGFALIAKVLWEAVQRLFRRG